MNHNELKHFGVLGMKWGVRRNRSSSKGSIGSRVKKTFDKWDKQEAAYQKQKLGKATKDAKKDAKIDATNYYKNPGKMLKKVVAKQYLHDVETKKLQSGKKFTEALKIGVSRSFSKPAIGMMSGKEASTGRAYLEAMQFTAATTAALGVAGTVAGYYLNK